MNQKPKKPTRQERKYAKRHRYLTKYSPIFINAAHTETLTVTIMRIAVKILLICVCACGLGLTLAQTYRIPISTFAVVFACTVMTAALNVIFLFFRKRALFIPAALFLIIIPTEEAAHAITLFYNHFLHVLNSRLISTAKFAVYTQGQLEYSENVRAIAAVFLVICFLGCLVFTLSARSRFIGIMLIVSVFLLTPAFGAEIAGYVWGLNVLIAGLLGIYTMWVAHAWENIGGIHQINYVGKNADEGGQLEPSPIPDDEERLPLYQLTPGSMPYFYKYSRNSIIAGFLGLFAVFTAATAVPEAVKFDYMTIVDAVKELPIRLPEPVQRFFKYNFGSINDNGFFPDSNSDISTGINTGRPPTGNIPIIRVSLEDDYEKIYLRGGIGIDFNGQEWSVVQNSDAYDEMLFLLQSFSPELEYHVYRQKLENMRNNGSAPLADPDVIGRMDVRIEYLARTGFLLIPAQPFDTAFKNNRDFRWLGDTYIRPTRRVNRSDFDVYYPRMSEFTRFRNNYALMLHNERALGDVTWRFPDDTTTRNYDRQILEYRSLIHQIYMNVPASEVDNIQRFLNGIEELSTIHLNEYRHTDGLYILPNQVEMLEQVQIIHNYFRREYEYSLTIDNTAGRNTTIGNFLHGTKAGHCAMYASSMVLAVRQLGLPARYVTGLVTVSEEGVPNSFGYEFTLAERDFHAWVEVYFEGIGWLPFDPTGGAHGQDNTHITDPGTVTQPVATPPPATPPPMTPPPHTPPPPQTGETTSPTTAPATDEPTFTEKPEDDAQAGGFDPMLLVIIGLFAMIPAVIIAWTISVMKRLEKAESSKFARFMNRADSDAAGQMYRFMFKLFKSEGVRIMPGEPPLEFGERADREIPVPEKSLSEIMPVFEKLEFSDIAEADSILSQDEYNALYEYVSALYEKVVTGKKPMERTVRRFKYGR
jgi:hypothetical protein